MKTVAEKLFENAELGIEGVEECICFGVPDSLMGSAARLLVKPKAGAELDVREIRGALAGMLDGYKVPASIGFVDGIAKTPNGKPDRKHYREEQLQ